MVSDFILKQRMILAAIFGATCAWAGAQTPEPTPDVRWATVYETTITSSRLRIVDLKEQIDQTEFQIERARRRLEAELNVLRARMAEALRNVEPLPTPEPTRTPYPTPSPRPTPAPTPSPTPRP